jgi:membrane fusion protein (multidrug efflux system)
MNKLYLSLALAALMSLPQSALAQKGAGKTIEIIATTVKLEPFADRVEALGTTKANESVIITTDTTEKIAEIHFEDGQAVRKGDVLIVLDKAEEEADLRAAEASFVAARSAYNRAKELQNTSALSKGTLQDRLAVLKQSEAAVQSIKARLDKLTITAPFDGILGLREVSVGTLVQPGNLITTIDDLSQIKVDFDVPAIFLSALRPALPISGKVSAFGERVFNGEVRTVNTQIDPVTRTVKVRAVLPNPDHTLKPGLLMSIDLMQNQRDALMIPEEALFKMGKQNFVYKIVSDGGKMIARKTEINIGGREPGEVEVLSGLSADDQIVSHGLVKLQDGMAIAVRAIEGEDTPLQDLLGQKLNSEGNK